MLLNFSQMKNYHFEHCTNENEDFLYVFHYMQNFCYHKATGNFVFITSHTQMSLETH